MSAEQAGASEAPEVVIYRRTEEWMALWNSGQFEGVMELYAKDALDLPAHHDPLFGRKQIREYLRQPMRQGARDFTLTTESIQLAGDLVYDIGRYAVTQLQADGSRKPDSGRYLVVWQRHAGNDWKILVFAAWSGGSSWKR